MDTRHPDLSDDIGLQTATQRQGRKREKLKSLGAYREVKDFIKVIHRQIS